MDVLPHDLFSIITEFAWSVSMTKKQLCDDINKVLCIRERVDDMFLTVSVFEGVIEDFIHNPYRSFSVYHPTVNIHKNTIFSNWILILGQSLRKSFFVRRSSYRLIFIRDAFKLLNGHLQSWNRLLSKYLIHIRASDFSPTIKQQRLRRFFQCLDDCLLLPPS